MIRILGVSGNRIQCSTIRFYFSCKSQQYVMSYIHNPTVEEDKLTKSEVSFDNSFHFP